LQSEEQVCGGNTICNARFDNHIWSERANGGVLVQNFLGEQISAFDGEAAEQFLCLAKMVREAWCVNWLVQVGANPFGRNARDFG